jgi:hypothetical protein
LVVKDEAVFNDFNWKKNQLSFKIKSSLTHTNGLTCMIPYLYNGKKINKIAGNGITQSYSAKTIKGFEYALLTIKPGYNYSIVVSYFP